MMEGQIGTENLIRLFIVVALSILIVGAVMVPIIDSASEGDVQKFINTGEPYMVADGRTHNIVISSVDDDYVIRTDGTQVGTVQVTEESDPDAYKHIISVGADSLIIFYSYGYATIYGTSESHRTAYVTSGAPLTFTVGTSIAYMDENGVDRTASVTYFAGKGNYVYAQSDPVNPIYLLDDTGFVTPYYGRVITSHTYQGMNIGYIGSGTASDYSAVILYPQGEDMGDTTVTVNATDEDGYVVNPNITFVTEWGYDESTLSLTSAIVPKEIVYGIGDNDSSVTGILLAAVPTFVVIGILVYAVRYMRSDEYI